eukprot:365554-Chlamydomonas_euryale.AAC.26
MASHTNVSKPSPHTSTTCEQLVCSTCEKLGSRKMRRRRIARADNACVATAARRRGHGDCPRPNAPSPRPPAPPFPAVFLHTVSTTHAPRVWQAAVAVCAVSRHLR